MARRYWINVYAPFEGEGKPCVYGHIRHRSRAFADMTMSLRRRLYVIRVTPKENA